MKNSAGLAVYWTLIYVRFWKLWSEAHRFNAYYANKFISFVISHYLGLAHFLFRCGCVGRILYHDFVFILHRLRQNTALFLLFAHLPHTFECTQTSDNHFIILFVSFSVCGIVYQFLVPRLLFILLNTLSSLFVVYFRFELISFARCKGLVCGCKLYSSTWHIYHMEKASHYFCANFIKSIVGLNILNGDHVHQLICVEIY